MLKHTARVILATLVIAAALGPGRVLADDGDRLTTLPSGYYEYTIWKGLDAQDAETAAGAAIYVGEFLKLNFVPISGVDSGDTWEVDCGWSGSTDTAPTTWITVQAETSDTTAKRLEPGDTCEWVRINKPTDTNDATTVWVVRARERQ